MYPTDVLPGYTETWRKIISVYPPIPVETMIGALGWGAPGMPSMYQMSREVRVNPEKGRIEIWERRVEPTLQMQLAGGVNQTPKGIPGGVVMHNPHGPLS